MSADSPSPGSHKVTPETLGNELKRWLRDPDEPDRVFPKNKKVEIVFLIEAVNAILPRTEGVEDITLIKLPGTEYEVPIILPEKLQAVARRRMLAQLRRYRDEKQKKLREHLENLADLSKELSDNEKKIKLEKTVGFIKAQQYKDRPNEWNCYIQPPGGDVKESTDIGMDGFCPACALFGTVIDASKLSGIGNESIGIKSRVEFDPAVAFVDKDRSVIGLTHNKVADGVSWTGRSLYMEHHVMPGVTFVGKVTLEDVSEAELKAFLAVLSALDRLGGRERVYGGIRVHLVGIRGGSYETVSALEIARRLAREYSKAKYQPDVGEVKKKVSNFLAEYGFSQIETADFRELLDNMELWDKLWSDTVKYDISVVKRILALLKGSLKSANGG